MSKIDRVLVFGGGFAGATGRWLAQSSTTHTQLTTSKYRTGPYTDDLGPKQIRAKPYKKKGATKYSVEVAVGEPPPPKKKKIIALRPGFETVWPRESTIDSRSTGQASQGLPNNTAHPPPHQPLQTNTTHKTTACYAVHTNNPAPHLERPQARRARFPQPALGVRGRLLQLGGGKLRPQLAAALIQQRRLRRNQRPIIQQHHEITSE